MTSFSKPEEMTLEFGALGVKYLGQTLYLQFFLKNEKDWLPVLSNF